MNESSDSPSTKFSVVIPTYNRAASVGSAIRSVLTQSYGGELELIVVDDGSTDSTPDVLGALDDRRVTVIRQSNRGRSAARNAGAAAARHPWLVFLDSDDRLDSDALARFDRARRVGVQLVVAPSARVGAEVTEMTRAVGWDPGRRLPWSLQAGAFAIDRALFDAVGGYCTDLHFSEHTEMAFALRRLEERPVVVVLDAPTVLVEERAHRYDARVQYEAATHLLRHAADALADDRPSRALQLRVAAEAARRLGRRRESVRLFARSLRDVPSVKTSALLARALVSRSSVES